MPTEATPTTRNHAYWLLLSWLLVEQQQQQQLALVVVLVAVDTNWETLYGPRYVAIRTGQLG